MTKTTLEVVSKGNETADRGPERRRLPRLSLAGVQFRLQQTGKIFSVVDVSSQGLALRMLESSDFLLFPVATQLEGTLNLKGEKHPLRCRVRHLRGDQVGCEFGELPAETRAALDRFLDPAALGKDLKLIPSSEPGTLWYHGPIGIDLLFKCEASGAYQGMTLYIMGNVIQWTPEAGISTGRTTASDERSETRGVMHMDTLLLETDEHADLAKLGVAKTLILSSNLPEDFKKWCAPKLEV